MKIICIGATIFAQSEFQYAFVDGRTVTIITKQEGKIVTYFIDKDAAINALKTLLQDLSND